MSDNQNSRDPMFNFDMRNLFESLGVDEHGNRRAGGGQSAGGGAQKPPRKPSASGESKGSWFTPLRLTIYVLAGLFSLVIAAASFWTEVLWYNQIGFSRVFWTQWFSTIGLGILGVLLAAVIIGVNMVVAFRSRPNFSRTPAAMRDYRRLVEYRGKIVIYLIPLIIGLVMGIGFSTNWESFMVMLNAHSFGKADPVFGIDISFFVFTLPFISALASFLRAVTIIALMIVVVSHYIMGAIGLFPRLHMTKGARVHVATILAFVALIEGLGYFLQRYELVFGSGQPTDGAMYTSVNAQLPAQTIMALIAVFVAVLFLVAAVRGTWRLPVAGIVVMALSSMVVGVAYPVLVERFKVAPNARDLESPYIQRNIDATYAAYGMSELEFTTYDAKTDANAGQLREDAASTSQIRLLDPLIIPSTVRQMQQSRPYYTFPDQFSVDRYTIDNVRRDTVIAVRELSLRDLSKEQRTWVNDHTVYTHGFGVVAAYGNTATTEGLPTYWEQSIPSKGQLGKYEPRVYFSPNSPDYSIVGAPKGAVPQELDYPDDNASGGQVNSTYSGNGGPSIGNLFNKLIYAIKFRSTDMFFSDQVNEKSQVLYDRDPSLRVSKVAPFLTLERRPYPAVVDMDGNPNTPKRLVWVVDGYTTSNSYPYSQHVNLDETTLDSRTQGAELFANRTEINYMRNSVKAIVDAYDGSVTLYQWDKKDPILKTWMSIFPGKVRPVEEISGDLMAHLRYPEDMFKVQRFLLSSYHVRNAPEFYTGGDRWKLSEDPTAPQSQGGDTMLQPPYYLTMKMPGQESAEFSLTSVFIPGGGSKRAAMAGFLAVDSETGSEKGKVRDGYGKLRLIALPSSTTVPGPGQVQQNFNTNNMVAKVLNLQDQQGSKVLRGNLLVLPVGGGLLYVQPVYVKSTGTTSYPQLRYVMVAFGGKIGFASTLEEALDQVFGGDSGGKTAKVVHKATDTPVMKSDEAANVTSPATQDPKAQAPATAAPTIPAADSAANPALTKALQAAKQAMQDADAAMKSADWAAYGEAQKRLNKAIESAIAAQGDK